MGLGINVSSCACAPAQAPAPSTAPNPNPYRFRIITAEQQGSFVIALVNYPDCTTFEGKKLLVFRNTTTEQLLRADFLDPHFCQNGTHLRPFARFEPTEAGVVGARALAQALQF